MPWACRYPCLGIPRNIDTRASLSLPCSAQVQLGQCLLIGQMVALGLDDDNLHGARSHDKIRIVVDKAIDGETRSRDIAMPPPDIGQAGDCLNELRLELVAGFLSLVQTLVVDGSAVDGGNAGREAVGRAAHSILFAFF